MTNLFLEGFHLKSKTGIEINIPINAKVTIIKTDDSTSVTKMINCIGNLMNTNDIIECTVTKAEIIVIKDLNTFNLLLNTQSIENHIIFIDKFDLTEFNTSIPFIEQSNNYFVVCAHRNIPKCGWSRKSIMTMVHDGNSYRLEEINK